MQNILKNEKYEMKCNTMEKGTQKSEECGCLGVARKWDSEKQKYIY